MDRRAVIGLGAAALVTGCAAPSRLILVPEPRSDLSLRPVVGSLMVRDVELPTYAASAEVSFVDDDGVLRATGFLWADAPDRAIRSGLVEALGEITGARVAGEPWPFSRRPAAEVTVRVTRLTARPGGLLDFAGQYAIAPVDSGLADRAGRFEIAVPLPGETARALGQAHSVAVAELAETIARSVAR